MSSSDLEKGYLLKSLSPNAEATLVCVSAPALLQEIIERQRGFSSPDSLVNLAKAAMSAVLLQGLNDIDLSEQISLQWQMNGVGDNIYTDSMRHGVVRATMTRSASPVDVSSEAPGIFQLRRLRGELKASGIINCTGNINEDIQDYMLQSEQKTCAVGLTLNFGTYQTEDAGEKLRVTQALGYLIHVLPEENETKREALLKKWHQQIYALGGASQWALSEEDRDICQEMTNLLSFSDQSKKIFDYPLKFECTCSEEKVIKAVRLSDEALQQQGVSVQEPKELLEVTCQYCGEVYSVPSALN